MFEGVVLDATETPVSRELIVRYLLGDLPQEDQVKIENRAFQDQRYLENIVAIEDDLVDGYVRGEISVAQRAKFEENFFSSERRRSKVAFARALATVTSDETSTDDVPAGIVREPYSQNSFLAFFRSLRPVAALSAAVLMLLAIGGAWLITESIRMRSELNKLRAEQQSRPTREKTLEEQIAKERARSEELAAQLQREQQPVPNRGPVEGQKTTTPSLSAIASVFLVPGLSRGGSNRPKLVITEGVRTARLQAGIDPNDDYRHFSVELRDQTGRPVWSRDKLLARTTNAGRSVFLELPASVLTTGSYELFLKGLTKEGKTEDVGYYYFEVLKK